LHQPEVLPVQSKMPTNSKHFHHFCLNLNFYPEAAGRRLSFVADKAETLLLFLTRETCFHSYLLLLLAINRNSNRQATQPSQNKSAILWYLHIHTRESPKSKAVIAFSKLILRPLAQRDNEGNRRRKNDRWC
jgi:hypothetical protein